MSNPKKPTALKVLEGNKGKRKLPQNEPKPTPNAPDMPDFLDDRARDEWKALEPELNRVGVLTRVDGMAFAGYCQAVSDVIRLTNELREVGETFTSDSGYIQQRPQVAMLHKTWDRLDKFARQLGIGAEHRAHIEVKKPDEQSDPLDEIAAASKARREAKR